MAYNKAREEKKWLLWKEAEEKRLRDLGVDEAAIQKLRKTDWEQFKSERRYQEHNQTNGLRSGILTILLWARISILIILSS